MPDYIVTDPNTGRTLKLTGDSPPTEQELEQIFANQGQAVTQQPKQESFAEAVSSIPAKSLGFSENLAAIGTGALLEPVAGLAGLGAEGLQALGFDVPEGADVVRSVQGLAYQPLTEEGKKIQRGIADVAQTVGNVVEEKALEPLGLANRGERVLDATGSPLLATIAEEAPEIIGTLASGGLGLRTAVKQRRAVTKQISEAIKEGDINAGNIAKTLDAQGSLVKNPRVKQAIRLMGDDDAAYSTAINFEKMNNATKRQVNNMLDVIESNKKSSDPTRMMVNRPADVIGSSLAKRVQQLDKIKKKASSDLGKIIQGETGNKNINVSQARNNLIDALAENDILVRLNDAGDLVADTSRTLTNVDEVINVKRLNNLLGRLQSGTMKAKDAHRLKRVTRELVDFGPTAPGATKVSSGIENAIKNLSGELNDSINAISAPYRNANKRFSESIGALKEADRMLGNRLMIGDELADSKFGALSKRIGTNLASREDVISLIDSVDEALIKRGFRPKDDIKRQVAALADLEKIFKVESSQSPFGFKARVEQGALDASLGGGPAVARNILEMGLDKFRDMNKLDFDQRMKALRELSKVKE